MKTLTALKAPSLPGTFVKFLLCAAATALWAMPGTASATLGNYPTTTVPLGGNATVTPDATPSNTSSLTVSTSINFKGRMEGNPSSGILRITDAHPAGTYLVTVTGFDTGGGATIKTFTLTVTTPATCNPVTFAAAANSPAGTAPVSAAIGDFNGDGKQDVVVANHSSNDVSVFLGNGAGGFGAPSNFGVGAGPGGVAVGDFNGDGRQDLAVANGNSNTVTILTGTGTGGFNISPLSFNVGTAPVWVAVGDFNSDGRQDLAVANFASSTVSILLGTGTGSFSGNAVTVGAQPTAVVLADFNGDGIQDLATGNQGSNTVSVLLGNGAGGFGAAATFNVSAEPRSIAVGDFNGDGKQDLATPNGSSATVSVLLGNGTGGFGTATDFPASEVPGSAAVGDFNGDGIQDLAVANLGSNNVSILLSDGLGGFGGPINFGVGTLPFALAIGDFDGDGKQDIVTANETSNDMSTLLRICPPSFSIDNVTHVEGTLGTTTSYVFTVTKTGPTTLFTQVTFTTQDGTATVADNDYQFNSATLKFSPADTSLTATVIVNGDNIAEPDEMFRVHLFNAVNATIAVADGTGTITNDDAPATPTPTPTLTPTPTPTPPTATPTPTPTPPTATPTPTPTPPTPTPTPPAPTPTPTPTPPLPSPTPTPPIPTPTPQSPTPTPTPTTTPIPSPTPTPGPTASPPSGDNLSTRGRVETGDNAMIGGFIISGNSPRRVIVRALGPSLLGSGISDVLPDPTLDLRAPDGSRIAFNDNWRDSQQAEIEATGVPPPNDLEAAIVTTLPPGTYTAVLRGNAQASGIALLEIYDLDHATDSKLANLSTRVRVQTADGVLIGGFRLGGIAPRTIVVRAIGPTLTQAGVANALADPTLELRNSQGALLFANDNWKEDGAGGVLANAIKIIGLSPVDDRESALMVTVPPGPYTAIVAGKNNSVGIGLIEIYNLQ